LRRKVRKFNSNIYLVRLKRQTIRLEFEDHVVQVDLAEAVLTADRVQAFRAARVLVHLRLGHRHGRVAPVRVVHLLQVVTITISDSIQQLKVLHHAETRVTHFAVAPVFFGTLHRVRDYVQYPVLYLFESDYLVLSLPVLEHSVVVFA
jgi:hypothetical protein